MPNLGKWNKAPKPICVQAGTFTLYNIHAASAPNSKLFIAFSLVSRPGWDRRQDKNRNYSKSFIQRCGTHLPISAWVCHHHAPDPFQDYTAMTMPLSTGFCTKILLDSQKQGNTGKTSMGFGCPSSPARCSEASVLKHSNVMHLSNRNRPKIWSLLKIKACNSKVPNVFHLARCFS